VGADLSKASIERGSGGIARLGDNLRAVAEMQREAGRAGRPFKFKAFISYSHRDNKMARWLHRALETYSIPASLRRPDAASKMAAKRLGRFFRDDEELRGAADLGALIRGALEDSEHFILLCSPAAAASQWVDKEIQDYKRLQGENRIIPIILSGTPYGSDECFPPSLKRKANIDGELTNERAEPMAVDMRTFGRRDALLKVIAGLLGADFDALKQRESARRLRRLAIGGAASLALGLLGLYGAGSVAETQARRAWGVVAQTARADQTTNLVSLWASIGALSTPSIFLAPTDEFNPVFARALGVWRLQEIVELPDGYTGPVRVAADGSSALIGGRGRVVRIELSAPWSISEPLSVAELRGIANGRTASEFFVATADTIFIVEASANPVIQARIPLDRLINDARALINAPSDQQYPYSPLLVRDGVLYITVQDQENATNYFAFDGENVSWSGLPSGSTIAINGEHWGYRGSSPTQSDDNADLAEAVGAGSDDLVFEGPGGAQLRLQGGYLFSDFRYDDARRRIVGLDSRGRVGVWDYPTGRLVRTVESLGRVMPVQETLVDLEKGVAIMRAADGFFSALSLDSGETAQDLQLDIFPTTAIGSNADRNVLIGVSNNGNLYVWRTYRQTGLSARAREMCAAAPAALIEHQSSAWNAQSRDLLRQQGSAVSNLLECACPQQRSGGVPGLGLVAPGACATSR
jgi:hypothetical protein